MLRAISVLAGAAALIGLSTLSGADRLARTDPALAAKVPTGFANAALRTLGGLALSSGRAKDAAAYGWHAVDRAPTDAEAVSLFAAGHLAAGDAALAQRAFRLAGRMGWRVPITQAYWLTQSLDARDYDQAAMRLDALLRQLPTLVGQQALLDAVERNPEARAALVERIDPGTVWLSKYLNEVFMLPPEALRQRGWVLADAAKAGVDLGCDASASLAGAMVNKGLFTEAEQLWAAQCPDAVGTLKGGEGFATLSLQPSRNPFAWQALGSGDVLLGLTPLANQQGQRLTIDGSPPSTRRVLAKLLVLPAGRYVLSWRAEQSGGQPSDRIRASLVCKGQGEQWLDPQYDAASKTWAVAANVPAGCQAQILSFALAAGGGSLWLEDVNLDPAP